MTQSAFFIAFLKGWKVQNDNFYHCNHLRCFAGMATDKAKKIFKGLSSKPSGDYIVASNFCFFSQMKTKTLKIFE